MHATMQIISDLEKPERAADMIESELNITDTSKKLAGAGIREGDEYYY
jgi:uncharacterized membrane protein